MLKSKITPQLKLFSAFADHWQKIVGGSLLLLSPNGQILADSEDNRALPLNDSKIIEQLSSLNLTEPAFIDYNSEDKLLVAPLVHDSQCIGYLATFNAQTSNAPLLTWGAENLTARLVDAELLQGMTDELIVAWNQLELIYHVTQGLALTLDLSVALKTILTRIHNVIDTSDGFFLMQRDDKFDCITLKGDSSQYLSISLLDNLVNQENAVIHNTIVACRQFWPDAPDHVETILATKLVIVERNVKVALVLINKVNQDFTTGDAKLLVALSKQIGPGIKNFIVHQRLIANERLAKEQEITSLIRQSLQPSNLPQVGGVSLAVSSSPSSEIGGDFYDFITVDDHRLTLMIGDVSVRGIQAATLTTVIRTVLRAEIDRGEDPHVVIENANKFLRRDLAQTEAFVTVLIVTIDSYNGKLSYASAGHLPGMLWRHETRAVEKLIATAPKIGVYDHESNQTQTVDLHPGDTVVLFTDGITGAQSPNGDVFGLHRLSYIIENRANEPPEQLQKHIQSEIANFRRNASTANQDDATLLILKMLPLSSSVSSKDISTIVRSTTYTYPADTSHLTDISKQIISICHEIPMLSGPSADDFINLVELATSEICTNIIRHAYKHTNGEIQVEITLLSNGIQLDFYDKGIGFDPNTIPVPQPDKPTEGGYGLHIIRQIMDVVSYQHHPETGNHWHLLKLFSSN
jgi:serine phosphatase RsbU (regulator of sigma subunit)/anti-sigma regulatory factor (Ser/Thr protein kinase)